MIGAAPEGSPPRRISKKKFKKNPVRRASERPLRRSSIVYITIFMVRERTLCSCLFLRSQNFSFFREIVIKNEIDFFVTYVSDKVL
jgi:hypothetical protein